MSENNVLHGRPLTDETAWQRVDQISVKFEAPDVADAAEKYFFDLPEIKDLKPSVYIHADFSAGEITLDGTMSADHLRKLVDALTKTATKFGN